MARGRKSSLRIVLSAEERHTLEHWPRSTTLAGGLVRRGTSVLLLAARHSHSHMAQALGVQRTVVRQWARRFLAHFSDVCGQAARTVLETWTLPEQLAAVPTARLAAVLTRLSHGHFGTEKARAVKEGAHQSIGVRRAADALGFELRLLLRQIRNLEHLVAELDRETSRRYAGLDQYLRTIPSVGQATAPAIYAESGDIRRFTDSDQLVALVGVDPQWH